MEGSFFYSFNLSFKVVGTLLEKSTYSDESCYRVISFSITQFLISKTIIRHFHIITTNLSYYLAYFLFFCFNIFLSVEISKRLPRWSCTDFFFAFYSFSLIVFCLFCKVSIPFFLSIFFYPYLQNEFSRLF